MMSIKPLFIPEPRSTAYYFFYINFFFLELIIALFFFTCFI